MLREEREPGDLQRIAVIGAGTMGQGIAQVCATRGFKVILIDIAQEQLERARAATRKMPYPRTDSLRWALQAATIP